MSFLKRKHKKAPSVANGIGGSYNGKPIGVNGSSKNSWPGRFAEQQQVVSEKPLPTTPSTLLPKAPDPSIDPVGYLRSIYAVRQQSQIVLEIAKKDELKHFRVDMSKFEDTAKFVMSIIRRDFAPEYSMIPPYGRWQQFEAGGIPRIDNLVNSWPSTVDSQEKTRRLLDLFVVSVLLDVGAGVSWRYQSIEDGRIYRRCEGLAIASLEIFKAGMFSSDPEQPCRVDSAGLGKLSSRKMADALQVSEHNPLDGLGGRTDLLVRLADALEDQHLFGADARPGNMLDYLLAHPSTRTTPAPIILLTTLWNLLQALLVAVWPPNHTTFNSAPVCDAFPLSILPTFYPWQSIMPFHKLTQWLCYSLMLPMTRLLHIQFAGAELLTGIPDHRNGGLLMDTGLLTLRSIDAKRGLTAYAINAEREGQPNVEVVPLFEAHDDVVVEWRAVTVGLLDDLLGAVNRGLGLSGRGGLTLAQMLEAGTLEVSLTFQERDGPLTIVNGRVEERLQKCRGRIERDRRS